MDQGTAFFRGHFRYFEKVKNIKNRKNNAFDGWYLELLAATVSSLHAARTFDMRRTMAERDMDGNVLSDASVEVRTYNYATGLIPAKRMEELLCLISKDYRQSLMIFHQLIQGMIYYCNSTN